MPRTIAYRAGGFTNCGIGYTKFSQEELAEMKDRVMTENEAIECLKCYRAQSGTSFPEEIEMAINALEEIEQYRAIGTPEELQKAEKEENILKFYYCDSEDSYLVGLRVGNFYYAHYLDGGWVFDMSRYLPWGEHVKQESTAWKEHTYPSEPREINFSEWLKGFVKKECGGTLEECRAAVEKQIAKKPDYEGDGYSDGQLVYDTWICPCCGQHYEVDYDRYDYCPSCGQKIRLEG